jgi:5'-deoxynucleotidase
VNIIKTFAALSGLSSVHRFSMMKLGNPESVLEHVGFVTLLANLVARELNYIEPRTVEIHRVTIKALVHDLDELVVGDIPRPTKYHSPQIRDEFRRIEKWGVTKIVRDLQLSRGLQLEIIDNHQASKEGAEGLIVELCDVMAVAYKVWEEVLIRGNVSLVRQAKSVLNTLSPLSDKIAKRFPNAAQRELLGSMMMDVAAAMHLAAEQEHPMKEIMVP